MLRAVQRVAIRRAEESEAKLLSGEEVDDLIGHFEERAGSTRPPGSSPPRSGYVRTAPSDDDDGIEELVEGVIEGWEDDVA